MVVKKKLHRVSRVAGTKDRSGLDSVARSKRECTDKRAFKVLLEAQQYWLAMEQFRQDRERNKNYTYGRQWDDIICVEGKKMREEDYIKSQGNVALKNNLIRRTLRQILGVYRSQAKEPTCSARDREEQQLGETMSTVLQYNMQLNQMTELNARTMEEFLISGFVAHRKWYGWRNNKLDCWTDSIQPNNFFIDNNMRDPRGWDVTCLGELHDVDFKELCGRYGRSPADIERLREIYSQASDREIVGITYDQFGYPLRGYYDFLVPRDTSRCRVIEIWRKEIKPRYRCHDINSGEIYKIEIEDLEKLVLSENRKREQMGAELGMPPEEIPLIRYEWFMDNYWYYYHLSPFGDILDEGETPYEHKSHPYVFKAYPFIDGEIHSYVADILDQQRYVNRLIIMYDWIMRASAKGVLLFPEDCLPENMSIDDIADEWARFNGVIMIRQPKQGTALPQQVANNCTNIGIHEMLSMQLKMLEDISGVTGALQGKPGFSGMSASLYNQQTQNATTSLLDILDSFSNFVCEGASKDVDNIKQYYDTKRIMEIAGRNAADPRKILDTKYDLNISESTSTPIYRAMQNEMLLELFKMQAITVEQLLENGSFQFADNLLQSIRSQKEQMAQGMIPENMPPELAEQVHGGANQQAVAKAQQIFAA